MFNFEKKHSGPLSNADSREGLRGPSLDPTPTLYPEIPRVDYLVVHSLRNAYYRQS